MIRLKNGISFPGPISLGDYKPGELMAEWVRNMPMQRAGTGEDVAGLVACLAGPDAAYITGQTIHVDGGLIMS